MLAIRLQRTGRKGHAQYRLVVQDSQVTPTSGRVVYSLGHYDPHTKTTVVDKDKTAYYLGNGAQPTDRVVSILTAEGVAMPKWVKLASAKKNSAVKHPDKLRRNQPAQEVTEAPAVETPEVPADTPDSVEAPAEEATPEADS